MAHENEEKAKQGEKETTDKDNEAFFDDVKALNDFKAMLDSWSADIENIYSGHR
jgi:hypothetical protein